MNRCIHDTKEREREREREIRDVSVLSFGRLFVLWSTFSVPIFFPLFRREEEKTSKKILFFSCFAVFFTLLLFVLHQNKLRV